MQIETLNQDRMNLTRTSLDDLGLTGQLAWPISGNPFDVIVAISAGMRGAWVKRKDKDFCFKSGEINGPPGALQRE